MVDEFALAELLLVCVTRIRRLLDERLKVHGVSVARKRVLGCLTRGPVRQAGLAATLGVTPRTISEMVDGLERDGLVERRDDPKDRRARLVYLTPAGKKANELAMTARAAVITHIFSDLTPEQRVALAQMLTTVSGRVSSMTAAPEDDEGPYGTGIPLNALGIEGS